MNPANSKAPIRGDIGDEENTLRIREEVQARLGGFTSSLPRSGAGGAAISSSRSMPERIYPASTVWHGVQARSSTSKVEDDGGERG